MNESPILEESPIFNDIAKSIISKGGIVDVFREGRGVQGSFKSITQATGGMDYNFNPPRRRLPIPDFWCINHSRGTEMISRRAYENLEVRKIQPHVYHVIIPA
jgi:hypothetical protein